MKQIGIIGSGTWGTALAKLLHENGHLVTVWSAVDAEIKALNETHSHPNLPGVSIPSDIVFTCSIRETCKDKDIVVCAVPSVYVRSSFSECAPFIENSSIIVSVTKGIEESTLSTMSEIIEDELKKAGTLVPVVALSGPTHAEEVARGLATTIVAACENLAIARKVKQVFGNHFFKVFGSTDRKGVELCGALKNIIALAAGISDGLGYGDNAKAAIITRGMAEVSYLGSKMGCTQHTFFGLSGIGDMIVTATSRHSRNNNCGRLIGSGMKASDAIREIGMVVEGLYVLPAAIRMEKFYNVKLPIIDSVNEIVNNGKDAREVAANLLSLPATREFRIL